MGINKNDIDKAAWSHYWEGHPDTVMAENFRPDDVISFASGAEWAEADIGDRLYSALKGLGLEKHSIALNVLLIAGIELLTALNHAGLTT